MWTFFNSPILLLVTRYFLSHSEKSAAYECACMDGLVVPRNVILSHDFLGTLFILCGGGEHRTLKGTKLVHSWEEEEE